MLGPERVLGVLEVGIFLLYVLMIMQIQANTEHMCFVREVLCRCRFFSFRSRWFAGHSVVGHCCGCCANSHEG